MAGLALATLAAAGFAGNPLGGALSDRVGRRRALVAGLAIVGVGAGAVLVVRAPWHAFAATAILGFGAALGWPSQDALLAALAARERRSAAFSVRYATMNLASASAASPGR